MDSVVSADWLLNYLDDPNVVIIDSRFQLSDPSWGRQEYETSHIPGAFYLDLNQDLSSPVKKHGGRHPLPDPNILAEKFANMGIHFNETSVIAYDDSRFAFAARLWWLLRYCGHDPVAVLDGGWKTWQKAGYPVNADIPSPKAGSFTPQLREDWVVDRDGVKAGQANENTVIIDSRDPDRYRGEREPIDPVAGHISTAVNSPWKEITDEEGNLYHPAKQRQHWLEGDLPIEENQEKIVYCGSGVTACVNLLSLHLAQLPHGKLYAGSWSDWCSYLER
ncbi:MAG: sulfurtransferase [Halothece sp. Uz-M2-17]|nr:sulfurtransferase [Halothece sp. Uz-M2-17]